MTYEQRISLVTQWFRNDIASRFSMPNGIDPKVAASDVIESINSYIPSHLDKERIGNLLASVTKEVARSAKSRTLPTAKDFIDATRQASQAFQQPQPTVTTNGPLIDPLRLAAKRIESKQAVGEEWLKGARRIALMRDCGITEEQLRPYDLYIAAHTQ
jgi:hypothetical protein